MGGNERVSGEELPHRIRKTVVWPKSQEPLYDLLIRYCLHVVEGVPMREIARQFECEPSTISRQIQAVTDMRDSSPFIDEELDKVQEAGDHQMDKLARVLAEYRVRTEKRDFRKSLANQIIQNPRIARRCLLNDDDVAKLSQIAAEIGWRDTDDAELEALRKQLGYELSYVLIGVCCTETGLEQMEKDMKIPARSAKVLLQVAIRQTKVYK